MYVRWHTIRGRGGKAYTYLEVVVSQRQGERVRQERVCSLGRVEELRDSGAIDRMIAKLVQVARQRWVRAEALKLETPWTREYGPVLLVRRLWQDLGLEGLIDDRYRRSPVGVPVGEALLAMVTNRLVEPRSKRGTYAWLGQVYAPEWQGLELHHLYQALDFLDEHLPTIEEGLFSRVRDPFSLDVNLVLFDTTSTYFDGRGPAGLAALGYSRDKRPDRRQVTIGVLMTREGIPLAHYVFPGNTADSHAFQKALADVKGRFPLGGRVVVVADRGVVVAEPLLQALEPERQEYIVGIPLYRWRAASQVVRRAGRYQPVAENLRVKEIWLEGQRYVLCHNPQREPEDARRRAEIVAELEKKLAQGGLPGLARRRGYGRYLKIEEGGQATINGKRVEREARYDGKYLLRTTSALSPAEVAQAYQDLWRVEHAFRDLKSNLELRPRYHWTPSRVRGHIGVCFLALVVESALQRLLRARGCPESIAHAMEAVSQVRAVTVELEGQLLLSRTDLPPLAQNAFAAIGLRPPPKVQPLS